MSSRSSNYIVPSNLNDLVSVKRFLTNVVQQLDTLQGHLAENIGETKVVGSVARNTTESITSQLAEQQARVSDFVSLSTATLTSIADAMDEFKVNKIEQDAVLNGPLSRVASIRSKASDTASSIRESLKSSWYIYGKQKLFEIQLSALETKVANLRYTG